jgi:poly [ADP-ribose] polymerase 2/3/4
VVATEAQYSKRGARIRDAIADSLPIVTYDWLVASLNSDDIVDTTSYVLSDQQTGQSTPQLDDSGYASPQAPVTTDSLKSSSKRPVDDIDADDADQDQKKARTSTSGVNIPVDEHYQSAVGCKVYVDENGVAYDATLNQTDAEKNANKFYRCQLIEKPNGDFTCWTRWGRVGERGASGALGDGTLNDAVKHFEKKFKDKTGHTWINRDAPPKAKKVRHRKTVVR